MPNSRRSSNNEEPQNQQRTVQTNSCSNRHNNKKNNTQKNNTKGKDGATATQNQKKTKRSASDSIYPTSPNDNDPKSIGLPLKLIALKVDSSTREARAPLRNLFSLYSTYQSSQENPNTISQIELANFCVKSNYHSKRPCSGFSSCCFNTETQQTNTKYQTAQMIGLAIRLKEML